MNKVQFLAKNLYPRQVDFLFRWLLARVICLPALLMPYRLRMLYIHWLSNALHFPFKVYGRLTRILLDRLNIDPIPEEMELGKPGRPSANHLFAAAGSSPGPMAILYSGGTDSTCVAALMAPHCPELHLLTFSEQATRGSAMPFANIKALRAKFPETKFLFKSLSVDPLVRHLSYERYFHHLLQHRWLVLSNCGFSSISWHTRALVYCLENNIRHVSDGLTRELMHFPGHMDLVNARLRDMYKKFGVLYESPVREWSVPPDQQFIDRVIVNRYENGFFSDIHQNTVRKTTGKFLYDLGIFPSENVKGSRLDFLMQHDCYPFALYNIMAFWGYLTVEPYAVFSERIAALMEKKIELVEKLVSDWQLDGERSALFGLIQEKAAP